jgi:predicted O-methyltransferase YrrM
MYLSFIRAVRYIFCKTHLLEQLDKSAKSSPRLLWMRSLFSIYDLKDLVSLDVAWWTFDAMDLVESALSTRNDPIVFEWGSGASTSWLSKRSKKVIAIEHDEIWAQKMSDLNLHNVDLRYIPATRISEDGVQIKSQKKGNEGLDFFDYVNDIEKHDSKFDLIVIDGRAREACLENAITHLKPNGFIVFDNVERKRYRQAISRLQSEFEIIWTRGLTPALPYSTKTAVLFKLEP